MYLENMWDLYLWNKYIYIMLSVCVILYIYKCFYFSQRLYEVSNFPSFFIVVKYT